MLSPVQQAISNRNKKLVIGAAVIAGGLWILLVMYFLAESHKDYSEPKPGVVAVRSASPVASVPTTSSARFTRSTAPLIHHSAVSTPQWSMLPAASMGSTSGGTMHIYQTSSATVHSIGGGGSGGSGSSGGHGSGSRGIRYGGSYGSITSLAASIPLSSPGASKASDMSGLAAAPQRTVTPVRKVSDDPLDPFLDPVGDVTWGLFALLTIGWCVRVRLKKQRACK